MFKRQDVIIILWMTFLTVAAWIVFGIYHTWTTSTISEIDVSAISPIDPNFDMSAIDALRDREVVSPLYRFAGKDKTEEANIASEEAEIIPSPQFNEVLLQVSGAP